MQTAFNPELTANDIRSKSFLKSRDLQRETSGSIFFRDNKIRSCSYVKEAENCLKAVPFYDKRDNTQYPTPSTFTKSWNANIHVKPTTVYAGMGSLKPLHAYDPEDSRNSMGIPDFRPPYPNSSHIEIGNRSCRDVKHYVTNYGNSFITRPHYVPTSHPGIQAFRNKWVRSRLAK